MLSTLRFGLTALVLTTLARAASLPHDLKHVVHEETAHASALTRRGAADSDLKIPVRIGLRQENLHKGHDLLMEISQHDSPKFGKFYTPEEVADIFAPSTQTVDDVKQWLVGAGISSHRISQSANKQWLQFEASVAEADKLLRTEHSIYDSGDGDASFVAASSYHVPHAIQEHIDYITPGVKGLAIRREKRSSAQSKRHIRRGSQTPRTPKQVKAMKNETIPSCGEQMTAACIATLYNMTAEDLNTPPGKGNELGIYAMQGSVYVQSELDEFLRKYAPERKIPAGTGPEVVLVDGATLVTDPNTFENDLETMLDFEVALPIVYPQKTILYEVDDLEYRKHPGKHLGFFNTFLDAVDGSYCSEIDPKDPVYPNPSNSTYAYKGDLQCGLFKPANVITVSYALPETSSFLGLSARYQTRQCNEYLKLGLQGTTFLFASGDSGVGGSPCLGEKKEIFNPEFPANCPYVLSVGATKIPDNRTATAGNEVGADFDGSGGGFSNVFDTPSYQKEAVKRYLKDYVPDYPYYVSHNNNSLGANGGIYNRNGRGVPDVSAVGQNIAVFENSPPDLGNGTSAAAPIWASMLTKIIDMRMQVGKGPLGFINPVLYQHTEIFNDIVEGSNGGLCSGVNGTKGFTASPGWDPVTGLGTPKFDVLKRVLLDLP